MNTFLRRLLPFREIGWAEIDEDFTRFTVFSTRWLSIYIHRLNAPHPHPKCHDHPWSFVTVLVKGGYREYVDGIWYRRRPGSVLIRPAAFKHNVVTRGVSWSVIVAGPRRAGAWGFMACPE